MASSSTIPEHRKMLCEIGGKLKQPQVRAAAYLCHGKIPDGELDGVTDGLKLMTLIEKHKLIKPNCNDWRFLIELLRSKGGISRNDLAEKVAKYAEKEEKKMKQNKAQSNTSSIGQAIVGASPLSTSHPVSPPLSPISDQPTIVRRGAVKDRQLSCDRPGLQSDADSESNWQCVIQHPDWKFTRRLAVGESSIVYKGHRVQKRPCRTVDGLLSTLPPQEVAAKVYRLSGASKDDRTFLRQVDVLEELQSNDNVVKLIAVLRDTSPPCLVLDLAPSGDLRSFLLADDGQKIGPERLLRFAAQVADGMSYLETGGFIHGNLRASNVLVFDEDVVKISGFSLARHVDDDCDIDEDTMLPLRWTAIEVILYRQFKLKSDVWSFGIFLIELLTHGSQPYTDLEDVKLLSELRRGYRHPRPLNCPSVVYSEILSNCWKYKPTERPDFSLIKDAIDLFLKAPPSADCSSRDSGISELGLDDNRKSTAGLHVRPRVQSLLPVTRTESEYLTTSDMQTVWKTEGWEVEPASIQLIERIGAGQFGKVWKGLLNTGEEVAVKTFTVHHLSPESFLKEAHFMTSLQPHPHIVQLLGICTKPDTEMFIVTELMTEGDLNRFLRNDGGQTLKLKQLVGYSVQVCDAMSYIESLGAVHRDIAARNVLVADSGNTVKLSDFGMARFLTDSEYRILGDVEIPVRWTGPEVFKTRTYTIKSDVWAFGIFLVELVTFGETPYPEMNISELIDKVKTGHRHPQPGNCPDNIYELMIKCWRNDPLARPSFTELSNILVELHATTTSSC